MEGQDLLCELNTSNTPFYVTKFNIICVRNYLFSLLDVLGMPQNRLVYAAIFGLMSDTFISLIRESYASSLCNDGYSVGNIVCKTG